MLARPSRLLAGADKRIRALITLAHAVCADETPLRVGAKTARPGRKKTERYLLVACTELCDPPRSNIRFPGGSPASSAPKIGIWSATSPPRPSAATT